MDEWNGMDTIHCNINGVFKKVTPTMYLKVFIFLMKTSRKHFNQYLFTGECSFKLGT